MSEILACQILILDGTTISQDVNKRAVGQVLLNLVYKHLGLDEKDYFGLMFTDDKSNVRWLDPLKLIRKQIKRGPYNFKFKVKLYPIQPTYLFEESTRYYMSLQIRENILQQRLPCSGDSFALLAGYIVQGEFGDSEVNDPGYLDEVPFLENVPNEIIAQVLELHKRNKGLSPAECDRKILDLSSRFTLYGLDFHDALDHAGIPILLGISGLGVSVFCGEMPQLTKLNHFPWVRVGSVNYRNKQLILEMLPIVGQTFEDSIIFMMPSKIACKETWKSCIEHHAFFRSIQPPKRPNRTNLFRRGSTFRYSGRTQLRLLQEGATNTLERKPSRRFERLSSRNRFSNRQSHARQTL
ncbi:band 4.1-like protein 3 [Dysidea avara]|uniref:band 4.1-like protein 3 n=1 Tax=Dysidea avara TaxID=196820 RepID=UPI0033307976